MRGIFAAILLMISLSLFAQESGHIVLNPLTGELEYVTNPYAIGDSLVNLGYDNNIDHATLSTMIGYGNYLGSPDCITVGWDNGANCGQNFAIGRNIRCDSDKVIMLGMSTMKVTAKMPGSVAFCPTGEWAVMHVHSGYAMSNNGFYANIGGVRIGNSYSYNSDSTALEIVGRRVNYIKYEDTGDTTGLSSGDLWTDTTGTDKTYEYAEEDWNIFSDTIYYQTTEPAEPGDGNLWFDTDDNYTTYSSASGVWSLFSGNSYIQNYTPLYTGTTSAYQLIATENDEWTIDRDEMTMAGSIETGYLECDYTPKVHSAAADTSIMHTPLKIGDYFIDTSARDVYISTGTARGSWRKVN